MGPMLNLLSKNNNGHKSRDTVPLTYRETRYGLHRLQYVVCFSAVLFNITGGYSAVLFNITGGYSAVLFKITGGYLQCFSILLVVILQCF